MASSVSQRVVLQYSRNSNIYVYIYKKTMDNIQCATAPEIICYSFYSWNELIVA